MKRLYLLLLFVFLLFVVKAQNTHVVQRGETLDLIASRYGVSAKALKEANPLVDEYYVGITLSIPPKPKKVTKSTTKRVERTVNNRRSRRRSHSVREESQSNTMWGGFVNSYQPITNPFMFNEQVLWQSQHSQLQSSLNAFHNQMMQSAQIDFNNFMQQQIQQSQQFEIQGRVWQEQLAKEAAANVNWNNIPIVDTSTPIENNNTSASPSKTKVSKNCPYCNGKGETIQHEYVSTFGLDGPRVHCNICNQSWSHGTVHAHHRCNHCNGTGRYDYEY